MNSALMSRLHSRSSLAQAGFTLFELLVTISIIGLLIALVTVSFSTAQRNARDTRRRGDLGQLRNAFEQYYSTENSYPLSCATASLASDFSDLLQGGIPIDPDPDVDTEYTFTCAGSGVSYEICVKLEGEGSGNADNDGAPTTGGDYYCVWSLQ